MSYTESMLSPYRGDTTKEVMEVLSEDHDMICSSLEDRGLLFGIAYITIMSLSILKAIVHVFTQLQKPKATYDHLSIVRGMRNDNLTSTLIRREAIEEVKNHDNVCPNDKKKEQRANTIIALRNYLYQHDLTIHIKTIKKINHKVSEDELLEMYRLGEITKPLTTTHITCGDNLNSLLKEVLEDTIDLKINKLTKETYIKVTNDDFLPIKQRLEEIYNESIKLKFD